MRSISFDRSELVAEPEPTEPFITEIQESNWPVRSNEPTFVTPATALVGQYYYPTTMYSHSKTLFASTTTSPSPTLQPRFGSVWPQDL